MLAENGRDQEVGPPLVVAQTEDDEVTHFVLGMTGAVGRHLHAEAGGDPVRFAV
nr:hypothetical protein [Gordonia sp. CNJ-863]